MCNLISEADVLLAGCQELMTDSLIPSMVPCENLHVFNWQDEQLQMTSGVAEHGFCYFAKEIAALGSKMDSSDGVDLVSEMLASMSSILGLGKLVREYRGTSNNSLPEVHSDLLPIKKDILRNSRLESFCRILQSTVPSKIYLALKGDAFHEYLSSLSQISKSEDSRIFLGSWALLDCGCIDALSCGDLIAKSTLQLFKAFIPIQCFTYQIGPNHASDRRINIFYFYEHSTHNIAAIGPLGQGRIRGQWIGGSGQATDQYNACSVKD